MGDFRTIVCNASTDTMTYASAIGSILSEDARRKSFEQTTGEAYTVQSAVNQPRNRGRSSSCGPSNPRNQSKSRDARTCNYCKKPVHITAQCRALQAKNEKPQKNEHKGQCTEEVNYCGSTSATEVTEEDPNILTVESMTETEVLLTTDEATSWLLDSGVSFHVTPYRSQFRHYTVRSFDPVHIGNSQHCAVVRIGTVDLNLPSGQTLVLHDVRHVPELTRLLISVGQLDEAGHLSKATITHLSKAGYIPKLSFSDHQFCEHCQYNEQVVVPQSTSTKRIEPLRFGLFGCLWTHATSVSRWHVILRHLHR